METEAILLVQKLTGENTNRLSFLAPGHGHLTVFKKVGKSISRKAQPDLFDTATIHLQTSKDGKYHHLGSYHPSHRRSQIAKKYENFQAACNLATFMNMNASWIEDSTSTYRLLEKALDAFNDSEVHPSIILLKTHYVLLQQEGYPVRQDWRVNLPRDDQENLAKFLHQPLKDLQQVATGASESILSKLFNWSRHHTSFHFKNAD
jgi:recombinational DNA repair protein (RecF pathway)